MLSVKQGGIKNHFLILWYDSTWDWTQASRAIDPKNFLWLVYVKQSLLALTFTNRPPNFELEVLLENNLLIE